MFKRGESDDRQDPIDVREVRPGKGSGGGSAEVTVVGQGARLEGDVVSAGSLRIDGQIKGRITAEGDVTMAAGSQVEADVHAKNVLVAGRFRGNIVVTHRAELAKGGRVDGNITAKSLVVAEGAMFSGQSTMAEHDGKVGQGWEAPPPEPPEGLEQPTDHLQEHGEESRFDLRSGHSLDGSDEDDDAARQSHEPASL